ncbi:glycosyltransferase [Methylosinus sp. Ce-a6]|uniref:glycosyltransferase n=1 Tax=Methylosinus sp. Ce-a6 TaxID=2172005 RepID=UPI001358881B|nr:glycosyltransferase [Methylosinus sp. Ce-a6]
MISVLIPTYRRPEQLREALQSVEMQERALISEILIGDNSDDANAGLNHKIIADSPLHGLIELRRNVPPLGSYPNQCALGSRAKGEFVALLHDDDAYCEGALARLYGCAISDTDSRVAVWFGRNLIMDEHGVVDIERSHRDMAYYGKGGASEVRPMWEWNLTQALPPNGWLMRADVYRSFMRGPRDGNVGDWGLWVRLANAGYWGRFIAEDIFAYRSQPVSLTSTGRGIDCHLAYEAARELRVPREAASKKLALVRKFAKVAVTRYLRDGERGRAVAAYFSDGWSLSDRASLRGLLTLAMLLTPSICWRWALRSK